MSARRSKVPREVFLSHANTDRRTADALADTLVGHGVPVWYSKISIQGAQQWHDQIGRALRRCDWYVLLLSPSAVRSQWVKRELLYALNEARYEERIVPLIARSCDWRKLSWTLGALQFIELQPRFEAGSSSLLALWGIRCDTARIVQPSKRAASKGRS